MKGTKQSLKTLLIPLFSLMIIAGCFNDSGTTPDTAPEATHSFEPVDTECGPLESPDDPTFTYGCTWQVDERHGTYLAIELLVEQRTQINTSDAREGIWEKSHGYYNKRTLGVTAGEGFVNDVRYSGSLNTCSSENREFSDCEQEQFDESSTGGFRTALNPGNYLLFYAAFGADEWELKLDIQFENPVQIGKVEGGATQLRWIDWTQYGPGTQRTAHWEHEATRPFWAVTRHSGDVFLEEMTITVPDGSTRHWENSPDFPTWILPEQWDEDFGGSPNIAGTSGTWTFETHGTQNEERRLGVPIMGIAEDPFFVDPDYGLKDYGP